jgi:hypothetical protein
MDPVNAVERDEDSEAAAASAEPPRESKRLKKKKRKPAPALEASTEGDTATDEPSPAVEDDDAPVPARAAPAAKAPSSYVTPTRAAPKASGWPKEVVVLGMVLSGIGGALAFNTMPMWNPKAAAAIGKPQTVEVTLVAADKTNLACSSDAVVDGLHCGFGADGKKWAGEAGSGVLQPFTTTDKKSILGAGLWDDAALKGKLPSARFRARCDFTPAGEIAAPKVRWAPGAFKDAPGGWRAGRLSSCTILEK